MSAIVLGKRTFFEELPTSPTSASGYVSKRPRFSSSTSSVQFPSFPQSAPPSVIDQLRAVFPDMEQQILERALEECGNDLDAAIKSLHNLCLGYAEANSGSAVESNADPEEELAGTATADGIAASDSLAQDKLPLDGAGWVELFIREMTSATSTDDARSRAARVLESLEKSISLHVGAEAAQSFHKENAMLKEQIEVILRENNILKRAVSIQHERQKEFDERNQEAEHLKQLVSQYQEQLRTLEVNNYALSMHLKQSLGNNSMLGTSNPDVF